ncbi:MAG TPA: FISUMP domain-containing protein [bacterium]|nr:FISUMP domain-containing protein [bacterium]
MKKKLKHKHHGFTLVELIVVAGIITLLATLSVVGISKARMQARDVARTEKARSVVLALESYYNKHNSYPAIITPGQKFTDSDGILYINEVPSNPRPQTDGFCPDKNFHYEAINGNSNYILTFCLGTDKGSLKKGLNYYQNGSLSGCGTLLSDRDGYTYNTVQIGGQCWMADNLKTRTKPNGTALTNLAEDSERDCSNTLGNHGTETDCAAGNALYTWAAAMNDSTGEGAQGLCPDGWHIPSDGDWYDLESFLKDTGQGCVANRNGDIPGSQCDSAGTKMLSNGTSGFNTIFSGLRATDPLFTDNFIDFDYASYFWSSTLAGSDKIIRSLNIDTPGIIRQTVTDSSSLINNFSVRCLKNY